MGRDFFVDEILSQYRQALVEPFPLSKPGVSPSPEIEAKVAAAIDPEIGKNARPTSV